MICNICGNRDENIEYRIREMMFGTREIFIYFQCSVCECLQLREDNRPEEMVKYYSNEYYSFTLQPKSNSLVKLLTNLRNKYALYDKGIIGRYLYLKKPSLAHRSLKNINLNKTSRILEIGTGSGVFLLSLKELGFDNLLGIDPYIKKNLEFDNLKILKADIDGVKENDWDLIMLHHVFEHLEEPLNILKKIKNLLKPDGTCLMRIPVVTSQAWLDYRENWVQIDAPRHMFLHSERSMEILASKAHLKIDSIKYDSDAFQFWGSEQYIKDIPLEDERSFRKNPKYSIFTKKDIKNFSLKALELNKKNLGDQAVFYLRHLPK